MTKYLGYFWKFPEHPLENGLWIALHIPKKHGCVEADSVTHTHKLTYIYILTE